MRSVVLLFSLTLGVAASVAAQSPIILLPTTNLVWDETSPVAGFTPALAQALTYTPTVDGAAKPALTGITCLAATPIAPDQSANTCKALASQLPLGSHTVTLTAGSGALVSLPSVPLQFLTVVIPIPAALRLQ